MDMVMQGMREVLFFGILPDAAAAAQMTGLGRDLVNGDRLCPADRLHLSLLGFQLDVRRRDTLLAIARRVGAAIATDKFDVVLPKACSFARREASGPLVLRCAPAATEVLTRLKDGLINAAAANGLNLRGPSRFTPHVTLAYRAAAITETPLDEPIAWRAREVVLIRSEQGRGRYTYVDRWPLGFA